MSRTIASLVIVAFATAAPLAAQGNGRGPDRVPPGHLPSAGMCRVWIDGVPPGRQPAPTSCVRAERERYSYGRNARVVYGGNGRYDDRDGKRERRYVDASGRVCTEKTEYKKNGDRKTTVSCRVRDRDRDRYRNRYEVAEGRCANEAFDKGCDVLGGVWDTKSPSSYPSTLPEMIGAVIFDRGQRTRDVTWWLGDAQYRVDYADADRNGRPERASWFDGAGHLVQQWIDGNRDGRADVVRVYKDGRLVRVVGTE